MKLWVYEYLSGGGMVGGDAAGQAELLAQGLAMREALIADLARIPGCRASHAPAHGDETPVELVRRQAALHDFVWVVAPESEGLLARLCEAVHPARWIGCSAEAIRMATSKRATVEHLSQAGLPTPLAFVQRATAWIVKPDDGAGTLDTQRHASLAAARADVARRRQAGSDATLEAWVDGEALSMSLLCADGSAGLLAVNRQHIAVDGDGQLHFDGVQANALPPGEPRHRGLRELAKRIARALPGLRGFVGVDLVWHAERGPVVIEVNPRVTSAYVGLSAALGRNVAAEVLALQRSAAHV